MTNQQFLGKMDIVSTKICALKSCTDLLNVYEFALINVFISLDHVYCGLN
jgi:hypothetical protein